MRRSKANAQLGAVLLHHDWALRGAFEDVAGRALFFYSHSQPPDYREDGKTNFYPHLLERIP